MYVAFYDKLNNEIIGIFDVKLKDENDREAVVKNIIELCTISYRKKESTFPNLELLRTMNGKIDGVEKTRFYGYIDCKLDTERVYL